MSIHDHSHSRRNQLTGEWVLVSPHRTERPWQGQRETTSELDLDQYEADCFLCPGNSRANGEKNPPYKGSFVFNNDYSALSPHSVIEVQNSPFFDAREETGCCKVVCYSERHDLSLSSMSESEIVIALKAMFSAYKELDACPDFDYVQIFENRGQQMGCSNQHPHAQIWATENVPNEAAKEFASQKRYFDTHSSVLLLDYLSAELETRERVVVENRNFVVLIPYWAIWPFETLLLPRRRFASPNEMTDQELDDLAAAVKSIFTTYNRLFDIEMPYSMGFHSRPSDNQAHPEWQFHAHIYPPLLRSATVRKHLVGFEMLAMPQRDLTPELAAQRLRAVM